MSDKEQHRCGKCSECTKMEHHPAASSVQRPQCLALPHTYPGLLRRRPILTAEGVVTGSGPQLPPAHQPPALQPPALQPPAHQPPANQPPANQPPAHHPKARGSLSSSGDATDHRDLYSLLVRIGPHRGALKPHKLPCINHDTLL